MKVENHKFEMSVFELTEEAPTRSLEATISVLEKPVEIDIDSNAISFSKEEKDDADNLMNKLLPGLSSEVYMNFIRGEKDFDSDDFNKMTATKKQLESTYFMLLNKMHVLKRHMLSVYKQVLDDLVPKIRESVMKKGSDNDKNTTRKKIYLAILLFIGKSISSAIFEGGKKTARHRGLTFIKVYNNDALKKDLKKLLVGKKGKKSIRRNAETYLRAVFSDDFVQMLKESVNTTIQEHVSAMQSLRKYIKAYHDCYRLLGKSGVSQGKVNDILNRVKNLNNSTGMEVLSAGAGMDDEDEYGDEDPDGGDYI